MIRKLVMLLIVFIFIGCANDGDEKSFFGKSFLLKSIDIAGAQTLFTLVKGSYHTEDEQYLMHDLYMIDTDRSIRKVAMSFDGHLRDTSFFYAFDVNDEYFIISFYELKQTYFVEKANGQAHASAYFMPADFRADFAFDDAGNFYARSVHGDVLKVTNPISAQATVEKIPLTGAYTFLVNSGGNIIYSENLYDVYIRYNGVKIKLLDDSNGFWRGLDGNVKIVDAKGEIYRVEGEGLISDGAPLAALDVNLGQHILNFPGENKTVGIGTPKEGSFNFYELHPQREFRLHIPYHEEELNYFSYEVDRYGSYYFIVHGNGDGPLYLQRINVNTFEITERKINTTYSFNSFYGIHAVNEDLVLFGLCIPHTDREGCSPQFVYLDDAGEIKFLMEEKQRLNAFIGL